MAKSKKVIRVKVSMLDIDPSYNCREDYGDIQQLKNSIVENGVKTPLIVYEVEKEGDLGYMVISGYRRWEAIRQLVEEDGYEDFHIPVIIDNNEDEAKRVSRIITDNDRKPMTALEEAHVFALLSYKGQSIKEITEKCGRSEKTVRDYLLLFSADEEMKAKIRDGYITVTAAIKKLKKELRNKNED